MKKFKGALLGTLLLAAACAGGNMYFARRAVAALPEAVMSKWNKLTEMLDEASRKLIRFPATVGEMMEEISK